MITITDLYGFASVMIILLACTIIINICAISPLIFSYILAGRQSRSAALIMISLLAGTPLGIAGIIAGYLTGNSRESAVSATVPAVLTLLGVLAVYLVGKGRARAIVVAVSITVFSVSVFAGTMMGSTSRARYHAMQGSLEVLRWRAEQEFAIKTYREGLGLSTEPPAPKEDKQ